MGSGVVELMTLPDLVAMNCKFESMLGAANKSQPE